MSVPALAFKSVVELIALVRQREVSPVALVEEYLHRIEAIDGDLHSYITVAGERALESARVAERAVIRGETLGPLHGIPLGIKDQVDVAGMPTTLGSPRFRDAVADGDATVVTRLKAAGAIILGKQNCTLTSSGDAQKFAYGRPTNPWRSDHDAGASSNGSAIAVAAGLCAALLGEDTGGSIRVPASHNNVVGLRPSWGRVSRHGLAPIMWSADTVGPIARDVRDCALLLGVIAGDDPRDAYTATGPVPDYLGALDGEAGGLRVGIVVDFKRGASSQVTERIEAAADAFRAMGAVVGEVSLPSVELSSAILAVIGDAEVAARQVHDGTAFARLDPGLRHRIGAASLVPSALYQKALKGRGMVRREVLAALVRFDVLLSACAPRPPAKLGPMVPPAASTKEARKTMFGGAPYTAAYSLAGVPAVSVPCGFTKDGLPIGMQLAARPFDEVTLLRAAYAYERQRPVPRPVPALG